MVAEHGKEKKPERILGAASAALDDSAMSEGKKSTQPTIQQNTLGK